MLFFALVFHDEIKYVFRIEARYSRRNNRGDILYYYNRPKFAFARNANKTYDPFLLLCGLRECMQAHRIYYAAIRVCEVYSLRGSLRECTHV